MDFSSKPAWLINHIDVMEIANHHLHMPADVGGLTSLQDKTSFNSGMRQFLYWKGQFMPSLKENTLFLTFLGPNGFKPCNVINVTKALKSICDLSQVVEFHQGPNSNFFAISFKTKEQINKIISSFKFFEDAIVLSIAHNNTPFHRFRLLWLPPLFDIDRVHHLLNRYTHSHRIKRESIGIVDGAYAPTNVIAGSLTLEPGVDIKSLPHLIPLPSPHKGCALLTIESRPPLCLKCRSIGHTRNKCSMKKCLTCQKVHFPNSPCGISSYSSVASKNVATASEEDWLSHLNSDNSAIAVSQLDTSLNTPVDTVDNLSGINASPIASLQDIVTHHDSVILSNSADALECDRTHDISTELFHQSSQFVDSASHISQSNAIDASILSPTLSVISAPYNSSIIIPTTSNPTPFSSDVHFSVASAIRKKTSAKIHITERTPPLSSTARSHIITYSTAPSTAHSSTVSDQVFSDAAFGASAHTPFSSSEDEADVKHPMVVPVTHTTETSNRKRKGSSASVDSTAAPSGSLQVTPDMDEDSSDVLLVPSALPRATTVTTNLQVQIKHFLAINDEQLFALESHCAGGCFNQENLKILKLLYSNGIITAHILESPSILNFRLLDLKKRIKTLTKKLGVFTIADLLITDRIEMRINTGITKASPSGFFT